MERYLAGECVQVWAELQSLDATIRAEPLYADALSVAHETMQRVRHNIETLIPRLHASGYTFGYGWSRGQDIPEAQRLPIFSPPAPTV
ncbi:MAG: hypothetical protein ACRDID_07790, partial [Ktedonobacterales bacterium]